MRVVIFVLVLIMLAEFRAEVNGDPTIIGCFIRGFDKIEDGRCIEPE